MTHLNIISILPYISQYKLKAGEEVCYLTNYEVNF